MVRTPVLKGYRAGTACTYLLQCVLHACVGREAGLGVGVGTLCTLGRKINNADRFYRIVKVLKRMH